MTKLSPPGWVLACEQHPHPSLRKVQERPHYLTRQVLFGQVAPTCTLPEVSVIKLQTAERARQRRKSAKYEVPVSSTPHLETNGRYGKPCTGLCHHTQLVTNAATTFVRVNSSQMGQPREQNAGIRTHLGFAGPMML